MWSGVSGFFPFTTDADLASNLRPLQARAPLTLQPEGLLQRPARPPSPHPSTAQAVHVVGVVKFFAENQCSLSQGVAQFVFKIFPQVALLWLRHFNTSQNPADGKAAGEDGRRGAGKRAGEARAKSQGAVWACRHRHARTHGAMGRGSSRRWGVSTS